MQKIFILIALLTWMVPPALFALNSDSKQNIFVEADTSHLDHVTGIGTYRGHVKLTQGTTVVTSDTLITYLNKDNQLEKAIAIGRVSSKQLASYTTLPDNSKFVFNAVGETINYYPLKTFVELIGDAKATQGQDTFAGPQVNYDIKKQIVTSPPSSQGHTTITLQPEQKITP